MATEIQSTTQKMSGKQIDWDLLKELECPVCLEYMASPIKMCENGHNVCSSCKERLSDCPTCRGTFINVRNIVLEKLAASAVYPCKNREAGCEETLPLVERNKHLSACLYQSKKCPLGILSNVGCTWTGTPSDISAHIRDVHYSKTAEMPGHFKVKLLDLDKGRDYHQLVVILGELFLLTWDIGSESFIVVVYHFGPKEKTEAFKYGIKIGNSEEYIAVTRKCYGYTDGDLLECQPRKCVIIYSDTILDYVSESGYLPCEIEIGRDKLAGFVSEELQESLSVVSVVCNDAD